MALGNRYSQHSFAQIPDVKMARSQFDRSFTVKDTFDFDYLVPCFIDEMLPGDTANVNLNIFARLATQKVPIMDNMYIDFFFFFVPNRLVWENWEKFNGAQDDPGDSTDFLVPEITSTVTTGEPVGSIWDKFGLPTEVDEITVSALPFRAYNLIFNTWFRDQNLQDSLVVNKDNGPDLTTEYELVKRNKRHDYFTACLPEPQKGDPVEIPFSQDDVLVRRYDDGAAWFAYQANTDTPAVNGAVSVVSELLNNASTNISLDPNDSLFAQLSQAQITVNALRQSISIQSILELDMRGGTRYVEILQNHFNVISPDFRLQRPEYLGGGQARINSHPVAQTSPTSGGNAQAQLAAFATASSSGSNIGFTKSFVEHGYVIGLMCARADITYQQGVERFWSRQRRFDFFWPKLQEIGEQAVTYKEIYCSGDSQVDAGVFGYQEQYGDYRYKPSQIKGEFRSTYATSLDFWHMAEEFEAKPELNAAFIEQNTPIERAIAVTGAPHLLIDMWYQYKHARPMLTYSVPSTLGRF